MADVKAAPRKYWPRVLVVNGYTFDDSSGTGLTLLSLFKGWPSARLGCVHFSRAPTRADVCGRVWRLGREDDRVAKLAVEFLRGGRTVPRPPEGARDSANVEPRPPSRFRRLLAQQSLLELSRFDIPPSMLAEIVDYQPDVIYSMLASNRIMGTVLELAERTSAPVVPHFMDDWPSTLFRRSLIASALRKRMHVLLGEILRRSPAALTIGSDMAVEFQGRYRKEFRPFMNAVEPEVLASATELAPARSGVVFAYVGGLHLSRWKSLREIAVQLERLKARGLACELRVYTQARFAKESKRLELPGVVRLMGPAAPQEVAGILRDAHVLVHVESFDEDSRRYTRYSVSTKIPECMAARRPILAYGPGEVASIAYVAETGTGIAVGERSPDALRSALESLIASEPLRRRLGEQGGAVASSRHDASRQREAFRALLAGAAEAGRAPGPGGA